MLADARDRAAAVRRMYEVLERHQNGDIWTLHEMLLGFSHDATAIGRLVLAHDGTWGVAGDIDAQLQHKLAESIWWVLVIAERLDIDIDNAFTETMDRIEAGLRPSVEAARSQNQSA